MKNITINNNQLLASLRNSDVINSDKVLVHIHLFGGNDGLNTVIPLDQYDNLYIHRKNILIKEENIIQTSEKTIGFHPSLDKFSRLFKEGKMSIIQNVGYPNPNRSHFRSTDIWNSASPSDQMWTSGWLGRYFDIFHKSYPLNYPNHKYPDPLAINIGRISADVCQGKDTNYSYALDSLDDFSLFTEFPNIQYDITEFNKEIDFLSSTIKLTNLYTEKIKIASGLGRNIGVYDTSSELARNLKIVAKLISGGLSTKFYTLKMLGFDTHGGQTTEDTSKGTHADLLKHLSDDIYSFMDDLFKLGLREKVLIVVSTEFGRQIKSNNSLGTDHGCAAPAFLFGENFNQAVFGNNPIIPREVEEQEALTYKFDFRDIWGSILFQWFNVTQENIIDIFKKQFNPLNILNSKITL